MPQVHKCRSCGARILWAKTSTGKNIPVDYDPEIEYLWLYQSPVHFEYGLMKSHFATCPNSDLHRRSSYAESND